MWNMQRSIWCLATNRVRPRAVCSYLEPSSLQHRRSCYYPVSQSSSSTRTHIHTYNKVTVCVCNAGDGRKCSVSRSAKAVWDECKLLALSSTLVDTHADTVAILCMISNRQYRILCPIVGGGILVRLSHSHSWIINWGGCLKVGRGESFEFDANTIK